MVVAMFLAIALGTAIAAAVPAASPFSINIVETVALRLQRMIGNPQLLQFLLHGQSEVRFRNLSINAFGRCCKHIRSKHGLWCPQMFPQCALYNHVLDGLAVQRDLVRNQGNEPTPTLDKTRRVCKPASMGLMDKGIDLVANCSCGLIGTEPPVLDNDKTDGGEQGLGPGGNFMVTMQLAHVRLKELHVVTLLRHHLTDGSPTRI